MDGEVQLGLGQALVSIDPADQRGQSIKFDLRPAEKEMTVLSI